MMARAAPHHRRRLERLIQRMRDRGHDETERLIRGSLAHLIDSTGHVDPRAIPDLIGDVIGPITATVVTALRGRPVSATAPTTGQVLTYNGTSWEPDDPTAGTGDGHTVEDEGTPLTQRTSLNFVGAGVTAADSGGKTVVTIPSSALTVQEVDGSPTETPTTVLEFPNGTLTEPSAGVVRYTASATGGVTDATYVVRTAHATLTAEVLLSAVLASELQTRFEPITNGDSASPELLYMDGDVLMMEVANA